MVRRSKVVGHVYTLFLVLISWVLFRANSLEHALDYMKYMFGMGDMSITSDLTHLYLSENILVLVIGMFAALPFSKWVKRWYQMENETVQTVSKVLGMIALALLFFTSVSYLVKGTYNPFIYFNF